MPINQENISQTENKQSTLNTFFYILIHVNRLNRCFSCFLTNFAGFFLNNFLFSETRFRPFIKVHLLDFRVKVFLADPRT